jgi:type IV secretory pathway VirJ component
MRHTTCRPELRPRLAAALRAAIRRFVATSSLAAFALGARGAAAAGDDPLVHVPAAGDRHGPLVVLLSGDGDWVAFTRGIAESAGARGAPVLGLKSRTWFGTPRAPEESAAMLERAVRAELAATSRDELALVGYSRGADLVPFVVNRWPEDLRARVRAIVLIGPSRRASFEFHLEDLWRDVERATDVPVRPEIEKIKGIPITCVRGEDETASLCLDPIAGMRSLVHEGGHRASASSDTADIVLRALELTP